MRSFTVIIPALLSIFCISSCGGTNTTASDIPTSDPNGWVVETPPQLNLKLSAVTASRVMGGGDIWAAGENGTIFGYHDRKWTKHSSPATSHLLDITVYPASGGVWAVGEKGAIIFFDGTSWAAQTSSTAVDLRGVSAVDASHVWAVGDGGTILFFNGTSWTAQSSPTKENLNSVSAYDANHVWAVGNSGTVLFFDGSTWSKQGTSATCAIYSVSASDTNSVWAVGDAGTILHFNGSAWSSQAGKTTVALYRVASIRQDVAAFAVGAEGTILFYNGTSWTAHNSGVMEDLKGIAMLTGGNTRGGIAVGSNSQILRDAPNQMYVVTIYNKTALTSTISYGSVVLPSGWPCWAVVKGGGLTCGNYGNTISVASGNMATLMWNDDRKGINPSITLTYNANNGGIPLSIAQQIAYARGSTPKYLIPNPAEVPIPSQYAPVIHYNDAGGQPQSYGASAAGYVQTEKQYLQDSVFQALATKIVQDMGLDPTQGWGKLVYDAIYFGLKYALGGGELYIISIDYQISIADKSS